MDRREGEEGFTSHQYDCHNGRSYQQVQRVQIDRVDIYEIPPQGTPRRPPAESCGGGRKTSLPLTCLF